jgi:thiamine-phosphate pyrophosphorylase
MKIILLSPPDERSNEVAVVESLFAAGLERYNLRKPGWQSARLARWLEALPTRWRSRVFLHSHAQLAHTFRVGGIHFRDDGDAPADPRPRVARGCLTSRSCHHVAAVKAAFGRYDSILFGPVFPSLSKPGHGPVPAPVLDELRTVLVARTQAEKGTKAFALGGVTAQGVHICRALGFDGVAILGAVWNASDPVAAFREFQSASLRTTDNIFVDRGPAS